MFRHLLVPTDFSPGARRPVDQAVEWANAHDGSVELLHVVDPQVAVDTMMALDLVTPLLKEARHGLKRLIGELDVREGVVITYTVQVGVPWRVIVDRAVGFEAIVMGTQGRSGLSKLLLGSVAQRVVQHAPCPVVTIRQTQMDEPVKSADVDAVYVMFDDTQSALQGLTSLTEAGVSLEDVSVVVRDDAHAAEVDALEETKILEGTTAGGLIGGSVGGVLGGLAGMGVVSGGLGLLVVGSALALGAVGGVIGGLFGRTVAGDRAKVLRAELESGSVLIAVHLRGSDDGRTIRRTLTQMGGRVVGPD